MLYFQTWKLVLILGACLLGVIFSLPNAFSPETVANWPRYVPKKQVSLGLDLRGGSHLLLEVDMATVEKERLAGLLVVVPKIVGRREVGAAGAQGGGNDEGGCQQSAGDVDARGCTDRHMRVLLYWARADFEIFPRRRQSADRSDRNCWL